MNINIKISFFLILFLTILVVPKVSVASEIIVEPTFSTVQNGDLIKVNLYVVPGEDRINAAEGKLVFSSGLLSVYNINFENSILTFWPEQPRAVTDGVITFSGVTLGGYNSRSRGLLFSVVFKAIKEGKIRLYINDGLVLKDDGAGTATILELQDGNITVVEKTSANPSDSSSALLNELDWKNDVELPETFNPLVGSNPSIFMGKHFLVFATVDKQSGIDYYEVQESKRQSGDEKKWIRAESPYELTDQMLSSFIIVKAVDKAGNFRTETLLLGNTQKFYQSQLFFVILILIVTLSTFFFLKRKFK